MQNKIVSALFLFLLFTFQLKAQLFPKEGSKLNYRLIGFSFPAENKISKYKIELASGMHNTEDSFAKNIIKSLDCETNKLVAEVPSFGMEYTWRVVNKNNTENNSRLHHFSTGIIPEADTHITRLRIAKNADKYEDAYVFLDGNKALYDMNGNPVWYLPEIEGSNATPADLKLSPQGTITFILNNHAYEINYNGEILWKDPHNGKVSGDSVEHFHHQLSRLTNGHYMVLGTESARWNVGENGVNNNNDVYAMMPFGTVIEYDGKGNVVWSWKSSAYFQTSDVLNYKRPEGKHGIDVHENAFYFDEKTNALYVSFRDISRIVKVKYPEGTILNSYGETYKPGIPEKGNGLYCGQHSCNISREGNLYLFDNNFCHSEYLPKIEIFREPVAEKEGLKKIWEYKSKIRPEDAGKQIQYRFSSGGNVVELPDHSMFVSMGNVYGEIFIVTMDKKILWSSFPEKWNPELNKWDLIYQYRANIITSRMELEHLIWNLNK